MDFYAPLEETIIVGVDEPFTIIVKEQPIVMMKWEADYPSCIELIDKSLDFEGLLDIITLDFKCTSVGTYTMTFNYRKQCCDKRIVSTRTYHIVTDPLATPIDVTPAPISDDTLPNQD